MEKGGKEFLKKENEEKEKEEKEEKQQHKYEILLVNLRIRQISLILFSEEDKKYSFPTLCERYDDLCDVVSYLKFQQPISYEPLFWKHLTYHPHIVESVTILSHQIPRALSLKQVMKKQFCFSEWNNELEEKSHKNSPISIFAKANWNGKNVFLYSQRKDLKIQYCVSFAESIDKTRLKFGQ